MVGGLEEAKLGQSLKKPLRSPTKLRRACIWAPASDRDGDSNIIDKQGSFWNTQAMP